MYMHIQGRERRADSKGRMSEDFMFALKEKLNILVINAACTGWLEKRKKKNSPERLLY